MEIKTEYIPTQKTARYVTYGTLSEKTEYFWFCLHGSNMLCEQMLYKFKDFNPQEHFVVAPEALNRFYANGFGGDVVASWMTSRDRLDEINDFSNYLSNLYDHFIADLAPNCRKIILGFSQGGTTAFRWLHHHKVEADILIGYSCWIPEDIDLKSSATALDNLSILYTYGNEDKYLTPDRIKMIKDVIGKNKLSVEIISYAGLHKIDRAHLKEMFLSYCIH